MTNARLYHNADCSKCRAALALLLERGVDVEVVNYLERPPSVAELRELLRRLAVPPSALVRVPDSAADAAALAACDEDAILQALAAEPGRMQRPILVVGERAVIARPPERVLELV
jgi:arsenate reductase (glutaredoxin)